MRSKSPIENFAPQQLRTMRMRAGLTTTQLAARAGVPRPNITNYESGARTVGFETLIALADALDVEPIALTTADPTAPTLADLRLQRRHSRVELAGAAGVSYDTWYAIETGRRRLTDDVAGRAATALGVGVDELRSAHDRTRRLDQQLRVGDPLTTARHYALRHRLNPARAALPATEHWARTRVAAYAVAAGLDPTAFIVATTPGTFGAATGLDVGLADHGMASWASVPSVVYIDPVKAGDRGDLERLVAHELAHLRWPSLGHSPRFFERVQLLLDTVPV